MSDFTNQQPRDTYPAILSLESNLISSSFKNVQDSKGNATALSLSTDGVKSEGKLWVTTATTTTTEQYALMRDQSTGEIYQQNISVAPGDVPASRQLTIQGTLREVEVSAPNTQNLSADRTWTIGLPDVVEITTSLSVPTLYTTSTVNMSGIPSSVTDTKALMLAPSDNLVYRTLGTYAFLSSVDFGDLADVDMTGLSDGYGIYYNSGTGNWEVGPAGGGGVTTFIALTDTPGAYAGSGEYFVKVTPAPQHWNLLTLSRLQTSTPQEALGQLHSCAETAPGPFLLEEAPMGTLGMLRIHLETPGTLLALSLGWGHCQ